MCLAPAVITEENVMNHLNDQLRSLRLGHAA